MNRILNSFLVAALALTVSACGKKAAPGVLKADPARALYATLTIDNPVAAQTVPTCAQIVYTKKDGDTPADVKKTWRVEVSRDACPSTGPIKNVLLSESQVDATLSMSLNSDFGDQVNYDVSYEGNVGLVSIEKNGDSVKAELIMGAENEALKAALNRTR